MTGKEAYVTVFQDRYYPGFDGTDESLAECPLGVIMPLSKALTTRWDTDAHMAMYALPGESEVPRLNKTSLKFFDLRPTAPRPNLNAVAVDLDLPDHGKTWHWKNMETWPPPVRQWFENVSRCMEEIPELAHAGTYLTRGGMRFVWPLEPIRRVGVELADSYLTQFTDYLRSKGLPVDECTTWNHLFRLPLVVRDQQAQQFVVELSKMQPLRWSPPNGLTDAGPAGIGVPKRTDLPDITEFKKPPKTAYKDLKHHPAYHTLTTGMPLAEDGDRHSTAMELAATIVALEDTNDPWIPFRLLWPSAKASEYPAHELWEQCVWVCRVHDGSKALEKQHFNEIRDQTAEAMGVKPTDVQQHLVLATRTNSNYYVWHEQRREWRRAVGSQTLLPNQMRDCETLCISPDIPVPQLLRHHGTIANHVVISYIRDKVSFDPGMGIVYEPGAPLDKRLVPRFNSDIDQWLRFLFHGEEDRCLDWLATILRLDRPTCALYIQADNDVGKGLLANGIARLWNATPALYEELIRNFQDGLTQCPLIYADEKVPEDPWQENDSSVFRRIIGTGRRKIFRKHMAPADLEGHPRLLITANNADALRIRESLDLADIRAIQQRVGYVKTDDEAGVFLKARASALGMPVQDMVGPWIDRQIAEHVLWLSENRKVQVGDRFLVEGWPSALTARLGINFGIAPLVGKFIVRVLRDKMKNIKGVQWGDGEILVNVDYVRDAWQHVMGRTSKPPGDQTLMKALRALSTGPAARVRIAANDNARHFWPVDPDKIERIAEEFYLTDAEVIRAAVGTSTGPPTTVDGIRTIQPTENIIDTGQAGNVTGLFHSLLGEK